MKAITGKAKFLLLSFTWGLPVSAVGAAAAAIVRLTGHKPHRWGYSLCFELGRNWGGFSMGPFIFVCRNGSRYLKNHEAGHSQQNCYFGPLMLLLVNIPSGCWYWGRTVYKKLTGHEPKKDYYGPWFEHQASELGGELYREVAPQKPRFFPETTLR